MRINPFSRFPKVPRFLIFFVTARCNCRCRFCFYRDRVEDPRPEGELRLEEIERFARLYGPLTDLSISGGEPFLRENLEEILRAFAVNNRPRLIEVPTNGSLPGETIRVVDTFCREFPRVRLAIQLSVDGPPETHDRIRARPGLFELAEETSRRLKKLSAAHPRLNVQVITVFSPDNRDRLEEFYREWVDRIFCHRLILTPCVDGSYRTALSGADRILYRRLEGAADEINRSRSGDRFTRFSAAFHRAKERRIERWEEEKNLGRYCRAGRSILVLRENGDLSPCEPDLAGFGNLRDYDYDIRRVLQGKPARDYFKNYQKIRESCHCSWSCAQTNAFLHSPRCLLDTLLRFQQATDFSPPRAGQK